MGAHGTMPPSHPLNTSQGRGNKRRRTSSPSLPIASDSRASGTAGKVSRHRLPHLNTLFDAVAGRLSSSGMRNVTSASLPARKPANGVGGLTRFAPEKALFPRRDVPTLDKDGFSYNMHRGLSERILSATVDNDDVPHGLDDLKLGRLPASDLLKAVHAYSSDFYAAATEDKGRCDWASLDETALLAVGILMEEEMRRLLGRDGWAVFTEGEDGEPVERINGQRKEGRARTVAFNQGQGQDESEMTSSPEDTETDEVEEEEEEEE